VELAADDDRVATSDPDDVQRLLHAAGRQADVVPV